MTIIYPFEKYETSTKNLKFTVFLKRIVFFSLVFKVIVTLYFILSLLFYLFFFLLFIELSVLFTTQIMYNINNIIKYSIWNFCLIFNFWFDTISISSPFNLSTTSLFNVKLNQVFNAFNYFFQILPSTFFSFYV